MIDQTNVNVLTSVEMDELLGRNKFSQLGQTLHMSKLTKLQPTAVTKMDILMIFMNKDHFLPHRSRAFMECISGSRFF